MADNPPVQRRLAAILAADVAGYSRLMGADDEGTLSRLKALRAGLIDPAIARHNGRIVKTTGDGLLVEFASVVDATRCAIAWQAAMGEHAETGIQFRIGVNLGDVIIDGDDIFGDGVNIAARLEGIAEPGGICLSEDAFRQVRGKVDAEFFDIGEQSLKNIARPVRVYRVRPTSPLPTPPPQAGEGSAQSARVGAADPPALTLPDKPSIAVLPFQNMSGDPEQEYFVDGMVEEIITALSRIRWLFVIARNSSFTYKGQSVDVKQFGRELGVRYVLEGSVRKGGSRVRITAQLIDAETGAHLWADRFDGSLEDVFDLQDKIAVSVAGVIEPALQAAEMRRSAARPTTDLTAYDLYLRALAVFFPITRQRLVEALGLLEQALAIDPRYGPALSWAAICHRELVPGWLGRSAGDIAPRGNRSCPAGAPGRRQRPAHPRQRCLRASVFRRGYRRHDRIGRSCACTQPELRPRLGSERRSQAMGRSTRSRDRAWRDLAAPQPARACGHAACNDRGSPFLQGSVRRGGGEAAAGYSRQSEFSPSIPPSGRVLCPYGAAR